MAKYAAGEASCKRVDQAIQSLGGNGLTKEYGLLGPDGFTAGRIAPVSREMILNFVAQTSLGLPRSYSMSESDPGIGSARRTWFGTTPRGRSPDSPWIHRATAMRCPRPWSNNCTTGFHPGVGRTGRSGDRPRPYWWNLLRGS